MKTSLVIYLLDGLIEQNRASYAIVLGDVNKAKQAKSKYKVFSEKWTIEAERQQFAAGAMQALYDGNGELCKLKAALEVPRFSMEFHKDTNAYMPLPNVSDDEAGFGK